MVTNQSGSQLSNWTLTWTFPGNQSIYNLWNGVLTQTGATVQVNNAAWNGTISNGGTVTFGFNANYSGTNQPPDEFVLNGTVCAHQVQGAQSTENSGAGQVYLPLIMAEN